MKKRITRATFAAYIHMMIFYMKLYMHTYIWWFFTWNYVCYIHMMSFYMKLCMHTYMWWWFTWNYICIHTYDEFLHEIIYAYIHVMMIYMKLYMHTYIWWFTDERFAFSKTKRITCSTFAYSTWNICMWLYMHVYI